MTPSALHMYVDARCLVRDDRFCIYYIRTVHAVLDTTLQIAIAVQLRVWLADIFNFMEDHGRYLSEEQAKHFTKMVETSLQLAVESIPRD